MVLLYSPRQVLHNFKPLDFDICHGVFNVAYDLSISLPYIGNGLLPSVTFSIIGGPPALNQTYLYTLHINCFKEYTLTLSCSL